MHTVTTVEAGRNCDRPGCACMDTDPECSATDGSSTLGTVNTLLTAIATNNYDALIANAAPALKSRITKATFTQVSTQLSPRLKRGYKLQYLGGLKQRGVEVFLWKIIYQDDGDDTLARLVIKENKVGGFWFQ